MDKSFTINARSALLTVVVLLALLSAWLLGSAGDEPATAVVAGEDEPRTIVMVGEGRTTVVPDQISFRVTVTRQARGLDEALASSGKRLEQVVAALRKHGVEKEHVTTTGLDMYPHYERVKGQPPKLDGYVVTQQAQVTVPDLGKSGAAITAAVDAGGTSVRVNDIRLEIGDPEAAVAKARDDAVEQATAKAKRYAEASGNTLGDVLVMAEVDRSGRDAVLLEESLDYQAATKDQGALSIHAGESDVAVRLEVTWELA